MEKELEKRKVFLDECLSKRNGIQNKLTQTRTNKDNLSHLIIEKTQNIKDCNEQVEALNLDCELTDKKTISDQKIKIEKELERLKLSISTNQKIQKEKEKKEKI